ncbi:SH3 domain-containing protein [Pseudohoeflea suaedae]|uniref:SH3 domain-containing protein n=1 Tax=Pseudohoeflea suaedae TaxID=877384 RepID=A0A4R5PPW1_9HYPH|nr:SH3 domain-containing protein [Pseudohoeflea suaedae]TDH38903.1 SH3 domain-containing protein [Pseudohoeflea suaedae]
MKTLLLASALAFASFSSAALAAQSYRCGDPARGLSITIDIAPENGVGGFDGMGRGGLLTPDGQGAWVNRESGVQFIPERMPPMVVLGGAEFPCEDAAAAPSDLSGMAPPAEGERPMGETDINAPGHSLGGKLREGPGTEFPEIATLPDGMPLIIISNSHVVHDDFEWFRVALSDGRVGYQWGGALCSKRLELAGLQRMCGATN